MKQILKRIFHHEELTREEACTLMQRMTGGGICSSRRYSVFFIGIF